MDSWMLWLDGALEAERATGAAPVFAATYISLSSEPVTPESVVGEGKRGRFGERGVGQNINRGEASGAVVRENICGGRCPRSRPLAASARVRERGFDDADRASIAV